MMDERIFKKSILPGTDDSYFDIQKRKCEMLLNFGTNENGKGSKFVADQTPTPTRLIQNCEEVGLFDDLKNVNPFEETFRQAIESKVCDNDSSIGGEFVPKYKRKSVLMTTQKSTEIGFKINDDDTLHTPNIIPYASGLLSTNNKTASNADDTVAGLCIDKEIQICKKTELNFDQSSNVKVPDTYKPCAAVTPSVAISIPSQTATILAPISSKGDQPVILTPIVLPPASIARNSSNQNEEIQVLCLANITPLLANQCHATAVKKPLKKIYPKPSIAPTSLKDEATLNPIKEKLKETLLKLKPHLSVENKPLDAINANAFSSIVKNLCVQPKQMRKSKNHILNCKSTVPLDKPSNNFKPSCVTFAPSEQNREAAKRYRNKLKLRQCEVQQRNIQLEAENLELKKELKALKTFLLAHKDCPVTKAQRQEIS